jgi:hypothetical protein
MMHGNKSIGTFGISYGIPHSMDNEISLSRPESWREEISRKAFSESDERIAGLRNSKV